MKLRFYILTVLCLLCGCCNAQQTKTLSDSLTLKIEVFDDSLCLNIGTDNPKFQMSFLMQGLTITMYDTIKQDSIKIVFPNARMVKHKVQRHPNEVKAMTNGRGSEKRPDLQPLISALNDTTIIVSYDKDHILLPTTNIMLDRERETLEFSVCIQNLMNFRKGQTVGVIVETSQSEQFKMPEFDGKRLSKENKMPPGGLGQTSNSQNDSNRNFKITKTIKIQ